MKDLLAKLDALHAKATPGEWEDNGGDIVANSASYVQTITIVGFDHGGDEEDLESIVALHNRWKEVRAYIATLEENVEQARRIAALGKVNIHDWRVYTMSHADDCKCFGCSIVDEYERP